MKFCPGWRYQLLVRLLALPAIVHTLWRGLRLGDGRFCRERLGLFSKATPASRTAHTLWVHAASVGEVMTVLPLLNAWRRRHADALVLVSTTTPTGARLLADKAPDIAHCYLPLDFSGACQRFVDAHHIDEGWIVETEIWPWLYAQCHNKTIPLTIVNGRISNRSLRIKDGLLANTWRRTLAPVTVLARTSEDADRYVALGAASRRTQVAGNLKFAKETATPRTHLLNDRPYVLAASTHANEEEMLVTAWLARLQQLSVPTSSTTHQPPLLVIAPRHPERGKELANLLQPLITASNAQYGDAPLTVAERSRNQLPGPTDLIYIADTLGELAAWYSAASAVFVGGSLIQRGGQNMLEPARASRAIVVGPHTGNFSDVMHRLQQADAIVVADDAPTVVATLWEWIEDPDAASRIGQRAHHACQQDSNVIEGYLAALLR